jgi:hypothetical protein
MTPARVQHRLAAVGALGLLLLASPVAAHNALAARARRPAAPRSAPSASRFPTRR